MNREQLFWDWFVRHQSGYEMLDMLSEVEKEKLMEELEKALHQYNPNLFFLVGCDNDSNEIIISAEGNLEYFDVVKQLVQAAPKIPNWKVIAFKPAIEGDFEVNYEGIRVRPKDLWFEPLENVDEPAQLGLRVYMDDYNSGRETEYLSAVYQVLDSILGEKSNAEDVQYVEISKISSSSLKQGLIKIKELPAFINWRKNKQKQTK